MQLTTEAGDQMNADSAGLVLPAWDTHGDAFRTASYGTETIRFYLRPRISGPISLVPSSSRWAILTAYNPGAAEHTAEQNAQWQQALRGALAGMQVQDGVNGEGEWAEPSLIVFGLSLRQALHLGRQFGQLAVVWGTGRRAALVWCQAGYPERHWVNLATEPEC